MTYDDAINLCDNCDNLFCIDSSNFLETLTAKYAISKIANTFSIYNNFTNNQTFMIADKKDPEDENDELLIFIRLELIDMWVCIDDRERFLSCLESQGKILSEKMNKNNLFKKTL